MPPALSRAWHRGCTYQIDGRQFMLLSVDFEARVLRILWRDTGRHDDRQEAEMLAATRVC